VTFSLIVWHEAAAITAEQAEAKLERFGEGEPDVFTPHPAVAQARAELLRRFSAAQLIVPPPPADAVLHLAVAWAHAAEVTAAVTEVTAAAGLVCYDPGGGLLRANALARQAPYTLTSDANPRIPDPDPARLDRIARRLGTRCTYVILERADGWFVQSAYRHGGYAIEYQEGGLDRHFHTETTDLDEVIRFLREFRAGDESYKQRHAWQRVDLS
jgi:hypothetical protein